eukprot:4514052-Prymnesium_polylepis.2
MATVRLHARKADLLTYSNPWIRANMFLFCSCSSSRPEICASEFTSVEPSLQRVNCLSMMLSSKSEQRDTTWATSPG